jgi:sugar lactone lactonase YvrE
MSTPSVRVTLSLCLCLGLAAAARAQQFNWTLVAGTPPQNGSADGAAADARYYNPNSLVADSAGNLYVTDTFNHTIRKVSPSGAASTVAGSPRTSGTVNGTGNAARFSSPNGIAVDAAGNLYVADRGNHSIRRITPAGVVTTFAGVNGTSGAVDGPAATARFNAPANLAFGRDDHLYVTDSGNHAVRRIAPDGTVSTFAGTLGTSGTADGSGSAARFNSPSGIVQNSIGDFYISDFANHTIRRMSRDGVVSTLAGLAGTRGTASGNGAAARFNFPTNVAVDPTDNVYVADASNDCIRRVTSDGNVTTLAGSPDQRGSADGLGSAARFYSPFGIAYSPDGHLYVADTLNHNLRRLTLAGGVSTFSGAPGNFGNINGTGAAAKFNYPQNLAFDPDGNLLVADWRNDAIRRVTPAGVVTSLMSTPGPYAIAYAGGVLTAVNRVTHTARLYSLTSSLTTPAVAGTSGTPGSADGLFSVATFNQPYGVAALPTGIYIADTANHTIRLAFLPIGGAFTVTTIAGAAGVSGSTNGAASVSRFASPRGLALDRTGTNLYVADSGSHTIRRITGTTTPVVSTVAGAAFVSGTASGPAASARFTSPEGVATDRNGNLYIADRGNHTVRLLANDGTVFTIGGLGGFPGYAEGSGTTARFYEPSGIVVADDFTVYVVSAANNVIMRGVQERTPVISTQPQSVVAALGTSVTLAVTATGVGLSYQWKRDGAAIDGATAATYAMPGATAAANGSYTVDVRNSAGTVTSAAAQVTLKANVEVSRIVNLAIRSQAGTGAQTLIVGVGVGGAGTAGAKPILIRAVGPTLGVFGVAGVLPDPKLEVFSGAAKINDNDNWGGTAAIIGVAGQVGAFALPVATSLDAALYLPTLAAGSYSVQVTGNGALATGVALAEIYDASPAATRTAATPRLTNVSARTQVGTDGDILIAGFVIGGETSKTVLIRAIGPTLGSFGVGGALADPKLELFGATGNTHENDNWGGRPELSATFFSVGAFPLTAASLDAVLLVTLAPGSYTAQISGVNNGTGVALVEVYEVP